MRAWVGSWTGCAGRAGARPGACSPTTWRRASSGPRRRASRGRNARAAGTALAVSLGDAFPPGSLLRPGGLMACADACGHAEPDTVRAPQPSQATTVRPARRAAEGGPSGAEAHGPVAPGACLRSPAPGGWPGRSGSPYHARDRVERVFEIARRGGKALPVCVQTEETLGGRLPVCLVVTAAARMMSDLARGRVDARGPARATRDRARRAAGHHRAREEDERGARGLRDQVPGHHQAASCEPRKCRELRLIPSWARTLATATAISAS